MKRFLLFVSMLFISFGVLTQCTDPASTSTSTRSSVETVSGYLHVFPNELGVFQSEPSNVIANINAQKMHGYNDWRLPTNEELSLLRANSYLSGASYMTTESRTGMVLLVTTGKSVVEKDAIEAERQNLLNSGVVVNLGLPSKTLWYAKNEGGDNARYTYDEAVSKFGNKLPSNEQFQELMDRCIWTWTGSGCKVVGPNGNSIYFPAAGDRSCRGSVSRVGSSGHYWSSTPCSGFAYCLDINSDEVHMFYDFRCYGRSVRLVQD